jgi:hypothetical protein
MERPMNSRKRFIDASELNANDVVSVGGEQVRYRED